VIGEPPCPTCKREIPLAGAVKMADGTIYCSSLCVPIKDAVRERNEARAKEQTEAAELGEKSDKAWPVMPAVRALLRARFGKPQWDKHAREIRAVFFPTGESVQLALGGDAQALQQSAGPVTGHLTTLAQSANGKAKVASVYQVLWDLVPGLPQVERDDEEDSLPVRLIQTLWGGVRVWVNEKHDEASPARPVPRTLCTAVADRRSEGGWVFEDAGLGIVEHPVLGRTLLVNLEQAVELLRHKPDFARKTVRELVDLLREAPGYAHLDRSRKPWPGMKTSPRKLRWHRIRLAELPDLEQVEGDDTQPPDDRSDAHGGPLDPDPCPAKPSQPGAAAGATSVADDQSDDQGEYFAKWRSQRSQRSRAENSA